MNNNRDFLGFYLKNIRVKKAKLEPITYLKHNF